MTDKELTDKLAKEAEEWNNTGNKLRLMMIYSRLAEVLVELHKLRKALTK